MAISTIGANGLTSPLPAANLGTPSAINLSNATALPKAALPAGAVLQVVGLVNTSTVTSTSAQSIVPLSITPSSASNKILVCASCSLERVNGTVNNYIYVHIRRGSTVLGGSGSIINAAGYQANQNSRQSGSIQYLDSPATTSPTTYDIYQDWTSASGVQFNFYSCNITLLEIAG